MTLDIAKKICSKTWYSEDGNKGTSGTEFEISLIKNFMIINGKRFYANGSLRWENLGISIIDGNPKSNQLIIYWNDTEDSVGGNEIAKTDNLITVTEYDDAKCEFKRVWCNNFGFTTYGNMKVKQG